MMRILVCDGIASDAVEMLAKEHEVVEMTPAPEELPELIGDFHAILVRSKTKVREEALTKASNLKVIGRAGVGTDNIDKEIASEMRIPVVNAPTGATISVAELAIGHMISISRFINTADATMKDGKWLKKQYKGNELYGKTLGLIGIGHIGGAVAERAIAFGMEIIASDPFLTEEQVSSYGASKVELDSLLETADYISLHVPLLPATKHMISNDELKRMKGSAYIINCSRGGIIDENALMEALEAGEIAGACLDTFEEEPPEGDILTTRNVVFTPHLGASTYEGQVRAGTIVAEQVLMVLNGQKPEFQVNKF